MMLFDSIPQKTPDPVKRRSGKVWQRWLIFGSPALLALPIAFILLRPVVARLRYMPRDGDVVFQSLPHNPLVNAIEGATNSRFSHCGIVAR